MLHYDLRKDRRGPVRGGSFNREETGSEANNFREIKGHLYGYAQVSRGGGFNLERLGSSPAAESVPGVLVAMFATGDGGGQHLVGWYRDAECYAQAHDRPWKVYGGYNFKGDVASAVLLPPRMRERSPKPAGRLEGGFGQANVRYIHSAAGELDIQPWMRETIDWIRKYPGPNMLDGAEPDEVEHRSPSRGRGPRLSTAEKKAVEARAMGVAKKYFRGRGFDVEDVHRDHPYDLVCTKGRRSLRVEVKGTTGDPKTVEVTKNEVASAREETTKTVLFVVSNIELRETDDTWTGHGGVAWWIPAWRPRDDDLTPTRYRYALPSELRRAT